MVQTAPDYAAVARQINRIDIYKQAASAVGGIPEVVVDSETGLLVPYDPASAGDAAYIEAFEATFADKVNTLTRDPELAQRMGKAGRRRCVEEFSWEKIAKETVAVYEAAIRAHAENK